MTTVKITTADLGEVRDQGTVWVLAGMDASGRRILFGADARPAADLVSAVRQDGEADCEIEPWQVFRGADARVPVPAYEDELLPPCEQPNAHRSGVCLCALPEEEEGG